MAQQTRHYGAYEISYFSSETADGDPRPAMATVEELRYAEQLRLQIREHYVRRPEKAAGPWWVGVE